MARKRSRNGSAALGVLAGSALAGIGLSFGRDTYKLAKDNLLYMILAFIFMGGTVYGTWNIVRGHDRGPIATVLKTGLGNGLLIAISVVAFALITSGVAKDDPKAHILLVGTVQGTLAAIGLLVGLIQRPGRTRRIRVARANARFLRENGFRDVGGDTPTLIAPDGSELKLVEERDDAFVYRVQGRRSVRAKITIDDHGRMTGYVPA